MSTCLVASREDSTDEGYSHPLRQCYWKALAQNPWHTENKNWNLGQEKGRLKKTLHFKSYIIMEKIEGSCSLQCIELGQQVEATEWRKPASTISPSNQHYSQWKDSLTRSELLSLKYSRRGWITPLSEISPQGKMSLLILRYQDCVQTLKNNNKKNQLRPVI